ncbi:hypothetical protein [Undibacterium pigrum]|uniref:Uncharacterized protein n=1 Tax=Undibacterium pigrum TaxID=401470 RepID=A0A318JA33_9BURK|nr:hypothetical protein [Undibacterium pigrum]PXX44837.1 hypothetical protein DFR42_10249 [Undibacterium pigrum]
MLNFTLTLIFDQIGVDLNYLELLLNCGYSTEIINIAKGDIKVPEYTFKALADLSFAFPPALIPLWSNASWPGYIGIVKHWFGNQPDTFVEYFSGETSIIEIAKNLQQLKAWMVFDFLSNVPDADEVGRFAESIGFCRADEVETIFAECEDVSDLAFLDIFKSDLPSILKRDERLGKPEWWSSSSGVDEIRNQINHGQFEQAWLQLNSGVSNKSEIASILSLLSGHVERKTEFQILISCWSTANS